MAQTLDVVSWRKTILRLMSVFYDPDLTERQTMEQNGPWAEQGISGKAGIVGLLFDPYSKHVLVHVGRRVADDRPVKCLYARHQNEERYKLFTPLSEILSYEDVILSPTGPFVFVNVFEASVDDGRFDGGFDWHSLQKIDLPSGRVISELKAGDLEPQVGHYSTWIASIVGIDKDGETIFVRLAIPQEKENKLRYCLAKLYLTQRRYELITELSGGHL